jgi:hypothetical protein
MCVISFGIYGIHVIFEYTVVGDRSYCINAMVYPSPSYQEIKGNGRGSYKDVPLSEILGQRIPGPSIRHRQGSATLRCLVSLSFRYASDPAEIQFEVISSR